MSLLWECSSDGLSHLSIALKDGVARAYVGLVVNGANFHMTQHSGVMAFGSTYHTVGQSQTLLGPIGYCVLSNMYCAPSSWGHMWLSTAGKAQTRFFIKLMNVNALHLTS